MKNFLVFILILANSYSFACGFYPFGEDTRICLFNAEIFGYISYSGFKYSSNLFEGGSISYNSIIDDAPISKNNLIDSNDIVWYRYCKGKVEVEAIDNAVYVISEAEINEYSKNKMIKYLYYQKDYDALNYLRFAKNCEYYNSWQDDPWERKEYLALEKRKLLFNIAIERSEKIKNTDLKRRYSFVAIRLAWYNHNFEKITTIFNTIFKQAKQKDIIYYWSLYFKSTINKNKAEANYELAQVFCNATDKRFTCHQYYNANIRIEQALEYCKNNTEKANVYILYGIENPEKALPYLKKNIPIQTFL